jgi:hypothetical protein
VRQSGIAGHRAGYGACDHAETEPCGHAPERDSRVALQLAGAGEIGESLEDDGGRGNQAPIGQTCAHGKFPEHRKRDRQQQPKRRFYPALQAGIRCGPFGRGWLGGRRHGDRRHKPRRNCNGASIRCCVQFVTVT